ncbi:DNA gyrase subunit A [Chitinivibrio alkaliphilus]|uniref:DNA gyrase subunit A n=1 Tax=Chitinivibrio alkaliphilus ACht1 TaxID=1313304 RepID=U7D827_9BACT|nr:DNA gyrase subunit A [Chitinivibrio alkaliphilus]ERP31726.1 DNA gyrase subunit A [Chitinivibrio alkaliphilus ACht1]
MSDHLNDSYLLIEDEMKRSYLDYSMSMITSRALPDVRDGLKPVHRRVLFAMGELNLSHTRSYKKSARVVGDVIGKYHPHGDSAVYDTLVRMAQDFSLRYPLVDGQGNFGSIDGDSAAAMRYTECRLTKSAEDMLDDLEKDTCDFQANYDESTEEPKVLPAKVPQLLLNGSTGIAVGMATNMAPHNYLELRSAIQQYIKDPDIDIEDLIRTVPGPDFPTGGIIYGRKGIYDAYKTGRGKVLMRARAEVEESGGREQIIITEIPYMVNKTTMLEKIVEQVRNGKIDGISFVRDESDRKGMRIVIGIKKDSFGDIVLNKLYKYTQLQSTFGINNLALVDGQPQLLNLKELISHFVKHRFSVITRRTEFELRKAEARAHILEGLLVAVDNIDEIVKIIRGSDNDEQAQQSLMDRFSLTEIQSKAILDMRLRRLTGLQRLELEEEFKKLQEQIADLKDILANESRVYAIISDDLDTLAEHKEYRGARKTSIVDSTAEVSLEDMIPDEDMVITMSHEGYVKRTSAKTYRTQGRGGRGVKGMDSKDSDFIETMFVASAHSNLLFFTNFGRCYSIKVYAIPETGRQSKGRPLVNIIDFLPDEKIAACIPVKEFTEEHYIVQTTQKGTINKQSLGAYAKIRRTGINSVNMDEDDRLVSVSLCTNDAYIVIATLQGKAIRVSAETVRPLGRNTRGVRGISLREGDHVIGTVTLTSEEQEILTVTENGFGKRTALSEYRVTNRGGVGIINIKQSPRNGSVVSVMAPDPEGDILIITRKGIIIRTEVAHISTTGRNTLGVKLINLAEDDAVIDVTSCTKEEEDSSGDDSLNTEETPVTEE